MLMASHPEVSSIRRRLLRWYDAQRRDLPWRAGPGEKPDPYKVWLSEIMLQQTTVATVKGHFGDFVARFPTLQALARADRDAVLHAWQGLGYYARARNLHKCARVVADVWGGRFPETEDELKTLPGIGDYTAAAVAAIAFGRKTMPVDANIERVTARLYAIADPWPKGRKRISELARGLTSNSRPGDFAQAMMDLGATLCRSRAPDCGACPLRSGCLARAGGTPERFPVKPARKARPVRYGMVFWAVRDDGNVLLRQRPDKGLLGGMMEIPSTEWRLSAWTADEAASAAPVRAHWRALDGVVSHTFTHFHLQLVVLAARVGARAGARASEGPARGKGNGGGKGGVWCPPGRFSDHALPTVMKKVARHAQGAWKGEGTDYSS